MALIELNAVFENVIQGQAPQWATQTDSEASFIRLSADTTPAQTASFVAGLCAYNHLTAQSVQDAITVLLSAETLVMPGGVAVIVAEQKPLYPSCCCGLESWREWLDAMTTGGSPWLGHDPAPWLEISGGLVTIWPDGGLSGGAKGEQPFCKLPVAECALQLQRVEGDISKFLNVLRGWVTEHDPSRAEALVAHLDQRLSLTRSASAQ
jgi:hypothetical protein